MKEIAIIGSYCDSTLKLKTLEKTIDDCKKNGLDVLVYGKYPIPVEIQNKCDFFMFEKKNPVFNNRYSVVWKYINDRHIRKTMHDFGFAAIEQIINGLGISYLHNYSVGYWINYDVDLTNFNEFKNVSLEKLKTFDIFSYRFDIEKKIGIEMTSMVFNIQKCYNKLNGLLTSTHYIKFCNVDQVSLAEHFMEYCFNLSELSVNINEEKPIMKALINNQGTRVFGDIPNQKSKLFKFFYNCYIGKSKDLNKNLIYIYNLRIEINEIVINYGNGNKTFNNVQLSEYQNYKTYEIIIDEPIIKLEIISVNGEMINEILDEQLDDFYFEKNTIEITKK